MRLLHILAELTAAVANLRPEQREHLMGSLPVSEPRRQSDDCAGG